MTETIKKEKPVINHLVLSGGGHGFFSYLGAFSELIKYNYIDIKNIKSIYATSAGSIFAAIFLLNIDIKIVMDYFIDRPWNELFNFEKNILNIINNNGLWDKNIFKKMITPLFSMCDIDLDITLSDFYKINNVDLYIYVSELKTFNSCEFSHISHPDAKLLDVIYMSSSIPLIFAPITYNNKYYIDGGFSNQYAINNAKENIEDENTIFGIKCLGDPENISSELESSINFLDMLQYLLFNPIIKITTNYLFNNNIYNELNIKSCGSISLDIIKIITNSRESRIELIEKAKDETKLFLGEKYNISLD